MADISYLKIALKTNGIDIEKSSDEEIRTFLQQLNLREEEITEAIPALRGKISAKIVPGIRGIFSESKKQEREPPSFLKKDIPRPPSRVFPRYKRTIKWFIFFVFIAAAVFLGSLLYNADGEGLKASYERLKTTLPGQAESILQPVIRFIQ